jgi:hypothetical protein
MSETDRTGDETPPPGDFTRIRVRGEMARRGLLRTHLNSYEDTDTQRWVIPRADVDMIAEAWKFLIWLDKETA